MTAQAIIFAINSAIRLGRNIQKAYANSLKSKSVLLPLPAFDSTPNTFTISRFFDTAGKAFVEEIEVLKYLHRKHQGEGLTGEEQEEYREYFRTLYQIVEHGESDPAILNAGINIDDVLSLLKIRQWERNQRFANTALQLVAGTIVEIGIDYFNQFPGAINEQSALGNGLKKFLNAIDQIPFSEEESFKKAFSEKVIPRLFITAAETLHEISPDIVRDDKWLAFIENTSKGITEDLYKRIGPDMSVPESEEAVQWGQLLLSSMIRNAGEYVFSDPSLMFDLEEGQQKLIKHTGLTILDLLYAEDELKIDLKALLNYNALDAILKSSFTIFAEYPELLAKEDSLRVLVRDVSLTLLEAEFDRPEMLVEILRVILEKTAMNLDKLWDYEKDQPEHLLVIALQQTLEALSYKTEPNASWKPKFSKHQLLAIFNLIFEEVIQHPSWITRKLEDKALLEEVIEVSFSALRHIPVEERLSYEVFEMILQTNLRVVASSPIVLSKINIGTDQEESSVLHQAMDLIFPFLFKQPDLDPVERKTTLRSLLQYILEGFLIRYPNKKGLVLIELLLSEKNGLNLPADTPIETIEKIGDLLLDFILIYPELVTENEVLQKVLITVAQEIQAYKWTQKGILPDIIALLLTHLAANIDQLILGEEGEPEYLISLAVKEILKELSTKNSAGEWRPQFSSGHIVALIDLLLEEVLNHPAWILDQVDDHSLLGEVLHISFRQLKQIPKQHRLSLNTLLELIELNLRQVARNPKLLQKIDWTTDEEEVVVLEKGIDLILSFVYTNNTSFALNRGEVAIELLDYLIRVVLLKHPDHFGLQVIAYLLSEGSIIDLQDGLDDFSAEETIELLLQIITDRPELLSKDPSIQNIISGVAESLEENGIDQVGLLPEVLRLLFIHLGSESLVIFSDVENESLKKILAEAVDQILRVLTSKPAEGKWRPQLSSDQIMELMMFILEEVKEDPGVLGKHERVYHILDAIFKAFEVISTSRQLTFSLIKLIIIKIFEAVRKHATQLLDLQLEVDGSPISVLEYILRELFRITFTEPKTAAAIKILNQPSVIDALLDYFLYRINVTPMEKSEIDQIVIKVKRSIEELESGFVNDDDAFIDLLRNNLV